MAARLCTSQQPSIGQRRSIAAMLSALSAERDEMTRRRDYWKTLAEGQDFTRVYLETCAERDALKAKLAVAVDTANQAIDVIASVQNDPWEENALTMCEHEVFDFDVESARAFLARATGEKP